MKSTQEYVKDFFEYTKHHKEIATLERVFENWINLQPVHLAQAQKIFNSIISELYSKRFGALYGKFNELRNNLKNRILSSVESILTNYQQDSNISTSSAIRDLYQQLIDGLAEIIFIDAGMHEIKKKFTQAITTRSKSVNDLINDLQSSIKNFLNFGNYSNMYKGDVRTFVQESLWEEIKSKTTGLPTYFITDLQSVLHNTEQIWKDIINKYPFPTETARKLVEEILRAHGKTWADVLDTTVTEAPPMEEEGTTEEG